LTAFIVFSFCASSHNKSIQYGISPSKKGYIPARIALLSCISWPAVASQIKNQSITNVPPEESKKLCDEFDQYVASGFDNQPFMKGLSPKFVEKLYGQVPERTPIPSMINQLWTSTETDCITCETLPSFYLSSIATRPKWGLWLQDLSNLTRGSDALLLPLLVHNTVTKRDERGLMVAERSALVALLLIDTTNGELIWAGGREATVASKAFSNDPKAASLVAPTSEELKRKLFTDAIWLDFPGRQIYK
jgi:hypothetical protein